METRVLGVRLSLETYRQLEEMAGEEGKKASELARELIESLVEGGEPIAEAEPVQAAKRCVTCNGAGVYRGSPCRKCQTITCCHGTEGCPGKGDKHACDFGSKVRERAAAKPVPKRSTVHLSENLGGPFDVVGEGRKARVVRPGAGGTISMNQYDSFDNKPPVTGIRPRDYGLAKSGRTPVNLPLNDRGARSARPAVPMERVFVNCSCGTRNVFEVALGLPPTGILANCCQCDQPIVLKNNE